MHASTPGWTLLFRSLLLLSLAPVGSPSEAQSLPSGALREVFTEIAGSTLSTLTNHASFPSLPAVEEIVPNFEAPSEWGENYGQRLRALLLPPVTGDYLFWIASDDQGALFLSTDESPERRRRIAYVNAWTAAREYTKEANQASPPVTLEAGKAYYLEALQKEGGGGDNLSVRWQLPDGTLNVPIPGANLLAVGVSPPVILAPPANSTGTEGEFVEFSFKVAHLFGGAFAWSINGNPIPGATNRTLRLGPLRVTDHGARVQVTVTNAFGTVTSTPGILSVRPDATPPRLLSAASSGDANHVVLLFSEPMQAASLADPARYTIDRGVTVLGARATPDGFGALLRTTPLADDGEYTVTVREVLDQANSPNRIPPGAQATFSRTYSPLDPDRRVPPTEPPGPSTRRGSIVVSEIHYHPADRADGRNLEFLELHNPQPWPEDIGGWRLAGDVDYRFPTNTTIPARGYVVLAAVPADIESIYGLTGVLPYAGNLPNDGGLVRLRNEREAIMWEVNYDDHAPWPVAPDGTGHSLQLARPSLGERDPAAWTPSPELDGSPGRAPATFDRPLRTIRINEIFARGNSAQPDFIELHNYGADPVDLADCALSDDASTNRFRLPAGTVVLPRGFVVFDRHQLGFALDPAGEAIFLRHLPTGLILDALRYGPQAAGTSFGCFPDGSPRLSALAGPTPGSRNAGRLESPVVLNEIMYEPAGGNAAAEFVELRNLTPRTVSLSGWRLGGGIEFQFPTGATLPPSGYVVVARDPAWLRATYTSLAAASTFGPFSGSLANAGDHLALFMPEPVLSTNAAGRIATNHLHVVVDEAEFRPGGRWPRWSAGGGSSLERVDPRLDGRLPGAWADSDESAKSEWVTVSTTGTTDLGNTAASGLELLLLGPGECLVDDVRVLRANEGNRITNSTFSAGLSPWVPQGNQSHSEWRSSGGTDDSACLLLRATGRGDTANRVRTRLTASAPSSVQFTLSARVRWLRGSPEYLMRLHGNWLESATNVLTTRALGSPGRANPSVAANAGPAISDVRHFPVLPALRQEVTVTATADDPDGLSSLMLRYRVDPRTNWISTNMVQRGAGLYSASIPGQTNNALVAWYIEAMDAAEPAAASSRFPSDAPDREALVRWGEPAANASFGSYRIWATQKTIDAWRKREKLSNDLLDVTAVIGRERVVYNVGARYSGSPYHAPGYDSPIGAFCDYQLTFPEDDTAFGETDVNLMLPGNGCCENTMVREQMSYTISRKLGLPFNHTRHVHVFFNGQRRAPMLMIDSQQANSDFVRQWWPEESRNGDGDLHKIALWFEFNDSVTSFDPVGASFGNFTSGGRKKLARYRFNWPKRSAQHDINNYTNLFALHDAMLTTGSGTNYTQRLEPVVDADNWARTVVVEHLVGNTDSFAYGGGQNMFTYKPEGGRWSLMIWDIDFAFQADQPSASVFTFGGGELDRLIRNPPFYRLYYRALREALDGPLSASFATPFLDARYNAFRAAGFSPETPQSIKAYLGTRRTYLTNQLARMNFPFLVTSTNRFATNANPVLLSGVAPPEVGAITIDGQPWNVVWTTLTNWTLRLPLGPGVHDLAVGAVDARGKVIPGVGSQVTVDFRGPSDPALGRVFINEWLADNASFDADPADGDFNDWIELYNGGPARVDLSNYSLANSLTNRTQWRFPGGSIIEPRGFLRLWADAETNQIAGLASLHAGFKLDRDGETIALFSPTGLLIDAVTFGPQSADVSSGRYPGASLLAGPLLVPTPGRPNAIGRTPAAVEVNAQWEPVGRVLQLTWPTQPGVSYQLESIEDLPSGAGAWTVIHQLVADGPSTAVNLDLAGSARRFFRVVAGR